MKKDRSSLLQRRDTRRVNSSSIFYHEILYNYFEDIKYETPGIPCFDSYDFADVVMLFLLYQQGVINCPVMSKEKLI